MPTVGYVLPPSAGFDVPDPEAVWRVVDGAERSPLEALWVSDHIMFWHPLYESLTLLAAVAARTQRIRLGPAVLLLAMRNPVIAAKTLASIDRLSNGRLTVGVGIGGEFPPEWEAVGVPRKTRAARTEEMISALRGLWGRAPFSMNGRHVKLTDVDLHPKPKVPPPIWIGGRSEHSVGRAARCGDGWMGIFLSVERFRERLQQLGELLNAAGRPADSVRRSLYVWTCIGESDAEARRVAEPLLGAIYNLPFEKLERYAVIGSPETCAARFAEYAEAGCEHVAVAPVWAEVSEEPLRRLVDEVMPRLGP